jgi:shikimate dehydrogenase
MRHFGLLGYPLGHSFSKAFFEEKFLREGISDAAYHLFERPDAGDFLSEAEDLNLLGFNVTIPHKQALLTRLVMGDAAAEALGVVNCVKRKTGASGAIEWQGYNTDVVGFSRSIKPFLASHHTRALVLGNGATAKSVSWVLSQLGIDVVLAARNPSQDMPTALRFRDLESIGFGPFPLVVNTTPVGTLHFQEQTLPIPYSGFSADHLVVDVVYNPPETALLAAARGQGAAVLNGLSMLQEQAEASWRIWNSAD